MILIIHTFLFYFVALYYFRKCWPLEKGIIVNAFLLNRICFVIVIFAILSCLLISVKILFSRNASNAVMIYTNITLYVIPLLLWFIPTHLNSFFLSYGWHNSISHHGFTGLMEAIFALICFCIMFTDMVLYHKLDYWGKIKDIKGLSKVHIKRKDSCKSSGIFYNVDTVYEVDNRLNDILFAVNLGIMMIQVFLKLLSIYK